MRPEFSIQVLFVDSHSGVRSLSCFFARTRYSKLLHSLCTLTLFFTQCCQLLNSLRSMTIFIWNCKLLNLIWSLILFFTPYSQLLNSLCLLITSHFTRYCKLSNSLCSLFFLTFGGVKYWSCKHWKTFCVSLFWVKFLIVS